MSIEAQCPGCQRLLRVDDEHAGKEARCPVCSTVYRVPEISPVAVVAAVAAESGEATAASGEILAEMVEVAEVAPVSVEPDRSNWQMRTPEGQTYGPASRAELDRWVADGRITHDCELRVDEGGWQAADTVYPILRLPPAYLPPAAVPSSGSYAASSRLAPHRGGLILVLALMGFLVGCPIMSIMAWVMGNGDLREMREGRMDPEGQGLTQAGYMLGMILSFVWVLAAVVGLFIVLVIAASK